MSRLSVKHLSKVQNLCGITTLQIRPYLGTSKCWGNSVLQTPALVYIVPFIICNLCQIVDLLWNQLENELSGNM